MVQRLEQEQQAKGSMGWVVVVEMALVEGGLGLVGVVVVVVVGASGCRGWG